MTGPRTAGWSAALKLADVGTLVVEVCRQVGITKQTFYRWKRKFVRSEIDKVGQLELP